MIYLIQVKRIHLGVFMLGKTGRKQKIFAQDRLVAHSSFFASKPPGNGFIE
jgi:hypothetical protein